MKNAGRGRWLLVPVVLAFTACAPPPRPAPVAPVAACVDQTARNTASAAAAGAVIGIGLSLYVIFKLKVFP
jgi:hypothetical protein